MAIAPGQTVTDVFTYEVSDGVIPPFLTLEPWALYATATITFSITRAADGSFSSSIVAKPAEPDEAVAAPQPETLPAEAAAQDDGLAAIRAEQVFEARGDGRELHLNAAASLAMPDLLGHHPQLA
jgi:hypothetical protein